MSDPLVDVILASNRPSPYVAETIRSVLNQTYPHWRLTFVDDGSPVPLHLAVEGVPKAQYIRQAGRGVSHARNTGLAATSGPLVAFLDDDDVWHADKLALQVQALRDHVHAVACFHGGTYIDAHGVEFGDGWGAVRTPSKKFLAGEVPPPRITTLLFRREACLRAGGFDPTLRLAEDLDFTLKVLQLGEMVCVDQRLVGYRRHDRNASQPDSIEGHRSFQRMLRRQVTEARDRGDLDTAQRLEQRLKISAQRAPGSALRAFRSAVRSRKPRPAMAALGWFVLNLLQPAKSALVRWSSRGRNTS